MPGILLSAAFLPDRIAPITESQVKRQGDYMAQIDLWNSSLGIRVGGPSQLFDTRMVYAVVQAHSRLATASRNGDPSEIQLWDLKTSRLVWSIFVDGPVRGAHLPSR